MFRQKLRRWKSVLNVKKTGGPGRSVPASTHLHITVNQICVRKQGALAKHILCKSIYQVLFHSQKFLFCERKHPVADRANALHKIC